MVLETLCGVAVLAETLTLTIVIVVIDTAEPLAGTLDTEMVLRLYSQLALPGLGL